MRSRTRRRRARADKAKRVESLERDLRRCLSHSECLGCDEHTYEDPVDAYYLWEAYVRMRGVPRDESPGLGDRPWARVVPSCPECLARHEFAAACYWQRNPAALDVVTRRPLSWCVCPCSFCVGPRAPKEPTVTTSVLHEFFAQYQDRLLREYGAGPFYEMMLRAMRTTVDPVAYAVRANHAMHEEDRRRRYAEMADALSRNLALQVLAPVGVGLGVPVPEVRFEGDRLAELRAAIERELPAAVRLVDVQREPEAVTITVEGAPGRTETVRVPLSQPSSRSNAATGRVQVLVGGAPLDYAPESDDE